MINAVFEGDPAHQAGLKVGDIILKVGGTPVDSPSRMIRVIGSISPGQTINIDVLRAGKLEVIPVKLEKQKKEPQIITSLLEDDTPPLGLEVIPGEGGAKGFKVSKVYPGSAAGNQGMVVGDMILAINGKVVNSLEEFNQIIDSVPTGSSIFFLVKRDEEKIHLALVR
jgi:serine protease Do